MTLLRDEIGEVLREIRQHQGRTLREISSRARVSLGYLSEVERGQKEASSEMLAAIAQALNVPVSHVLRAVSERMARSEGRPFMTSEGQRMHPMRVSEPVRVPDTVPDELVEAARATTRP